jgi:hypothetical protein
MQLPHLETPKTQGRHVEGEVLMFPWYINVGLVLFIFVCFRSVWACATPSGFPTHRLHPSELGKAKAGSGD